MKKLIALLMILAMICSITGCTKMPEEETVETIETPVTERANGVISADEWAEAFPEIYASYVANGENDENVQYLDESPYLKEIYEGFGFAKDYKSARAHNYTLTDVAETARPHALANCLTCKTADYTALINSVGTEAYSYTFDEVYATVSENVGCYSCHENQEATGTLVLTHDYYAEIEDNLVNDGFTLDSLTCGQCHTEYYFDSNDNKATSVPYSNKEEMDAEAELAFYDEIGYADYTQESTGAKLLKVQHPEIETYSTSVHASMSMSCADCHMAKVGEGEDAYTSHTLVSPLDSEEILSTCAKCHGTTDMAAKVEAIQEEVTAKEDEVGNSIVELKKAIIDAMASGKYSEDELETIRSLYRSACWYFDYCYVENSEGAHNSSLAKELLETSASYVEDAMALFTK